MRSTGVNVISVVELSKLPVFAVTASGDASQNADVDLSCSGLTELDLGADEVFIVSSGSSPSDLPPSPHTVRSRFTPEHITRWSHRR